MENFIVSARKYRPVNFDTVVGQQSITNTLKNAIRNKQLAQAFLFTGPRGIGKTTCAVYWQKPSTAKTWMRTSNPAINVNPAFLLTTMRPSIFMSWMRPQTTPLKIYEISLIRSGYLHRQVIIDIYIIDEVHMLSLAAFNAFLKTLEEPPAYAKFILATTEKHKIILPYFRAARFLILKGSVLMILFNTLNSLQKTKCGSRGRCTSYYSPES